ncbi:MAG: NADase-type glycan-binding domain-containing protein [Hyphomicrobiaceae bacterium]
MRLFSYLLLLISSFAVAPSAGHAQFMMDHEQGGLRMRGLHGPGVQIKRSFESDREAMGVFREILSATGIPGVAERISVRASADTENAEAQISENNQRFIFYNASFMQEMQAKTGRYWSLVFVVAHEVGHHIAGHLDFQGQNHQVELEADRYAGFILGRMGASYEDAVSAVRNLGTGSSSTTHPPRDQRIQAVALGWSDGRGSQRTSTNETTRMPAPPSRSETTADVRTASVQPVRPPRPRVSTENCASRQALAGREEVCVSSVLSPQQGNSYGAQNLFDGRTDTAWVEGKDSHGVGEWIVVEFDGARDVHGMTLRNGYAKNADIFQKNSRVSEFTLVFSGGERRTIKLRDSSEPQNITFPQPIRSHWVQITIDGVFKGSKYSDTAISELALQSTKAQ